MGCVIETAEEPINSSKPESMRLIEKRKESSKTFNLLKEAEKVSKSDTKMDKIEAKEEKIEKKIEEKMVV